MDLNTFVTRDQHGRYAGLSTTGNIAFASVVGAGWAVASRALAASAFRGSRRFKALSPAAKRDAERWVVSTVHAVIAAGWGGLGAVRYLLYKWRGQRGVEEHKAGEEKAGEGDDDDDDDRASEKEEEEDNVDPSSPLLFMRECCLATLSYFVVDLWRGRRTLVVDSSNTLHHMFGAALILGILQLPASKEYLVAPFYLTEASSVPLGITALMRHFGRTNTPQYRKMLLLFVVLFITFRIVMMTRLLYHVYTKEKRLLRRITVVGRGGLYIITVLQWFWLAKIVQKLVPRIMGTRA